MEIDTHVNLAHFKEYLDSHEKLLQKRKPRKYKPLELMVVLAVYGSLLYAYYIYQEHFNWPSFIILTVLFLAITAELLLRNLRIAETINFADDGLLLGHHHYVFDESGITASGKEYKMHVNWALVINIIETRNVLGIQLDGLAAFVLAKTDIQDFSALMDLLHKNVDKAAGNFSLPD